MPWIDRFKLALIQKDEAALLSLIETLPQFHTTDEMHNALALIGEAQRFFEDKKTLLTAEMQKILNTKRYIEAAL